MATIDVFSYEAEPSPSCSDEGGECEPPLVQHMNKLAGGDLNDSFAQVAWIVLRQRDAGLLELWLALGLHDPERRGRTSLATPQWCFLQAVWAHNEPAAEQLLERCGRAVDVNHRYHWDVVPWKETVAQMCWRECHGDESRDRPWLRALAWLATQGADFGQVKLNFHRWHKPIRMQESQLRTFDKLIWHLSDENGWVSGSPSAAAYLSQVVRRLVHWGAQVPEDLDPDFHGDEYWGVNGRRPSTAVTFCHGKLDLHLVHAAVCAGKALGREQISTFLCCMSRACPEIRSSMKFLVLSFLYPNLGQGRLSYSALHRSEGGHERGRDEALCSDSAPPPRGYVCGRCRQAGHWRKNCPRA